MRFLVRRLAQTIPLLVIVSVVVFVLIHATPGGPLTLYLENPNVRPEDIERLKRQLGLDRPLTVQYVSWLWAFVRGDWGFSYADGRPVMQRLLERVPATLELVGTSTILGVVAALAVGITGSVRRGFDRAATVAVIAGISLPVFWFGLVLQLVFANALGWFPSSGRSTIGLSDLGDQALHLVLPAIVLASAQAAGWSRYLRGSMRLALAMPFTNAARARGASESRVVLHHALRYALLPFVTVVLLDASIMASGAVVTESVFAWPGIGGLFTESLAKRDYTVLMAFLMCGSVAVAMLNLVADIAVHAIDPRTREAV
jgi:peptide/nickel transport system permease protein